MSDDTEFRSHVLEQLDGMRPFDAKKMFGGLALLKGGRAFAKVKHGALWLRADGETRDRFEERGMPQYTYGKNNDRYLNFYQTPAEVLEDVETLSKWAEAAVVIAERK